MTIALVTLYASLLILQFSLYFLIICPDLRWSIFGFSCVSLTWVMQWNPFSTPDSWARSGRPFCGSVVLLSGLKHIIWQQRQSWELQKEARLMVQRGALGLKPSIVNVTEVTLSLPGLPHKSEQSWWNHCVQGRLFILGIHQCDDFRERRWAESLTFDQVSICVTTHLMTELNSWCCILLLSACH